MTNTDDARRELARIRKEHSMGIIQNLTTGVWFFEAGKGWEPISGEMVCRLSDFTMATTIATTLAERVTELEAERDQAIRERNYHQFMQEEAETARDQLNAAVSPTSEETQS